MRTLLNKIKKLLKDRRTRRLWTRTISIVAALVVFVTTYALVLPAITMERQAYCGLEAHQHTDDCFERQLICTIPESPGHHHDDSCYTMRQEYSCTLEEHTHADGCYDEEGNLTCEIPDHTHEEGTCWQEVPELTCTLEESDGHLHDDSCYENVLVCGKEVHTHSEACYGNPDELLETAAVATTQEGAYGISTDEGFDGSGTYNNGDSDGTGDDIGWTDSDEYGNAARSDAALSDDPSTGLTDSDNAANGITAAGADVAGSDALSEEAQQDLTSAGINEEEDRYVPQLDPLAFDSALRSRTGIYYYHVREGEVVEDSSLITEWKKVDKNTELGPNDLLRVYLSYTIPEGSLNETNPTASYRLPANLHLTDDQVNGINAIENGISAAYIDYNTLTVTDPDNYHRYLGAEAVEGTRTPDQTLADYLAQNAGGSGGNDSSGTGNGNATGQEFISATVRVQNVYDKEGLYGEKGAYLGQDLIFTFSPYTIEKNQHTYDASGQPTRAGQKVRGWFALDFNLTQVDLDEPYIENIENVEGESEPNRENENADENVDEYTGEENTAVSEDGGETSVLISRELRTADIVFVEKDSSRNLDEISTSIKVVTAENYERVEENPDDAEIIDNTDNSEEIGEDQQEESEEGDEQDLTGQEAETGEDAEGADNEDKTDADATIMPAMSFEDSIRVRTGKPAGVEDGSAGSAAASAAEALPKKAKVTVRVEADEGTFPAGTTMVLSAVEDLDAVAETVMETVENSTSDNISATRSAGETDGSMENNSIDGTTNGSEITNGSNTTDEPVGADVSVSSAENTDTSVNADAAASSNTVARAEISDSSHSADNKNPKAYGFQAVDISFRDADGNEIEPAKPVRVALSSEIVEQIKADKEANENNSIADPVVVHLDDAGNAQKMELIAPEEIEPAQGKTEEELLEELEKKSDEQETDEVNVPENDNEGRVTVEDTESDLSDSEKKPDIREAETAQNESEEQTAAEEKLTNPESHTEASDEQESSGQTSGNADNNHGRSQETGENVPAENSNVFFETDSFSVYAIVYTVDFYWDVNGKMYQFSIPGGGFVSFTDLVEVLGIVDDTNSDNSRDENGSVITENAEENNAIEEVEENSVNSRTNTPLTLGNVEVSEATRQFVTDVASVEFSSQSLVDVSRVNENTTVGQVKENRGLECEYSAELSEEQIATINAQTVEAGDWALISVQPFLSNESLMVTMKDGASFTIRVTDGQIKKTVISASGETYEVIVTYGEDAQIPDSAELRVKEIPKEDKVYTDLQKKAGEELNEQLENAIPAHPVLFDISIYDGEKEIEPAEGSSVQVEIRLVKGSVTGTYTDQASPLLINDEPVTADEQEITQKLQIIHDVKNGSLETMDVKETATEEKVIGQFETTSFSNWLLFLDEDLTDITIYKGDSITLRPYGEWYWKKDGEPAEIQALEWTFPDNEYNVTQGWRNNIPIDYNGNTRNYYGITQARTKDGKYTINGYAKYDRELHEQYWYYHAPDLQPGEFTLHVGNSRTIRVHVIDEAGHADDKPGTVSGVNNIAVNLFDYDLGGILDVGPSWVNGTPWSAGYYNWNDKNHNLANNSIVNDINNFTLN